MNSEKIKELIKNSRNQYLHELEYARNRLHARFEQMTSHQITSEMEFISDMESRAYALLLLLEEIEDEDNK